MLIVLTELSDLDGLCRDVLGAGAAALLFRASAVGDVFGLRLDDDREVVVKIHHPREDGSSLAAVGAIQQAHCEAGFPCPRPLAPPAVVAGRYATIESYLVAGDVADTHHPHRRRAVAEALAVHLELCRRFGLPEALTGGWNAYPADRLWPIDAHDESLQLDAGGGAEWIDELAGAVKPIATQPAPRTLGHTDWSGKHFRFDGDRITAVYDWDSVRVVSEAIVVGNAAVSFTANWDLPGTDPAPTPDEVSSFIDEYDTARATRLTTAERHQIAACGTYLMAYTARCEYAREGRDGAFASALRRFGSDYTRV